MVTETIMNDKIKVKPTIEEFYANKSVLITGASGYLGKVLVEKLLRCCPLVSRVFLLLRSKNDKSPQDRWDDLSQQQIFYKLRSENPKALNKIVVVNGDVKLKGLGLSDMDKRILENEVSIVFHSAASVRFNDNITDAIHLNTRGSLEMIKLARKMKKLQCFLYVSTTYSNSNLLNIPVIEEKVYPSAVHYESIIKVTEADNPADLSPITPKILGKHPNTYTFSKNLAEQIMLDYAHELPIIIVRPSVVIFSLHEPFEGWVDNLNGVLGIIAGSAKGVIRVCLAKQSCSLDYVPADYAINSLIVAAWNKSVYQENTNKELAVYNCAYRNIRKVKFSDIGTYGMATAKEMPHQEVLWYPSCIITDNSFLFSILFYILQLFPAFLGDIFLSLAGSEPMLIKLNRKIWAATHALKLFSMHSFSFANTNLLGLYKRLNENNQRVFYMIPPQDLTIEKIMVLGHLGMRKYFFREKEDATPTEYLPKLNRLYWMDRVLRCTILLLFLWVFYTLIKDVNFLKVHY